MTNDQSINFRPMPKVDGAYFSVQRFGEVLPNVFYNWELGENAVHWRTPFYTEGLFIAFSIEHLDDHVLEVGYRLLKMQLDPDDLLCPGPNPRQAHLALDPVQRAALISAAAHRMQFDKLGIPYIEHPRRVFLQTSHAAEKLNLSPNEKEVVLQAAWLHDVIEDSERYFYRQIDESDLLRWGVNPLAVDIVLLLTRSLQEPSVYYEQIRQHPLARIVKLADIMDNSAAFRQNLLPFDARDRLVSKYQDALGALAYDSLRESELFISYSKDGVLADNVKYVHGLSKFIEETVVKAAKVPVIFAQSTCADFAAKCDSLFNQLQAFSVLSNLSSTLDLIKPLQHSAELLESDRLVANALLGELSLLMQGPMARELAKNTALDFLDYKSAKKSKKLDSQVFRDDLTLEEIKWFAHRTLSNWHKIESQISERVLADLRLAQSLGSHVPFEFLEDAITDFSLEELAGLALIAWGKFSERTRDLFKILVSRIQDYNPPADYVGVDESDWDLPSDNLPAQLPSIYAVDLGEDWDQLDYPEKTQRINPLWKQIVEDLRDDKSK